MAIQAYANNYVCVDVLQQVKRNDPDALHFYREEYDLIHCISTLKTPYVAFMNGHARKYL
jgi:3-hydroxyisobutyryl-CoA hydrolase